MPDQVLDAPIGTPEVPATNRLRRRGPAAGVARRRKVLAGLMGATVVSAGAGIALAPLRWVAVGCALLAVGYLAAVARARHRAVQREMARAFGAPGGGFDWAAFERPGDAPMTEEEKLVAATGAGPFAIVRFALAYLLGWVLTPVVIAIHLLAGDRRDLEGDGALARIVALQRRGRAHSFRALAVSLATTAGVTAVGGLAGMAAAPAASAAPAPGTYTVRAGDTLGAIAAANGTTVAALAAANHLADPNLIYPGQTLVLQGGAAAATPSASASSYTVQAGDTLGSIAARFATTWEALAAANHIADPNVIYVGQTLSVSGASAATPAAGGAQAAPASVSSSTGSYTVQAGDTLGSIAARFSTSWESLAAANHIADPNVIYVGETLSLNGAAASPAPSSPSPAPSPAPAAPAPSGSLGARALAVALDQVGKPYQWAGAGPATFDCSGLVMYAYDAVGVHLAHYTVTQQSETSRISESELQPGDLVFYGGAAPSHVAMYDGNGNVVTADTTGTPVRVEPISWDGTPTAFGRVG
ncbi:LysM peptidoglycan-binding domain-containing protein [Acidiferrimicrobium sp. IK]|uniref:C40 family peptidase n=1 Tax=Acidiferrimicrobium sp. IK TaxID=2871700 RepID=UPI0021CB3D38|nr:LysM peptidoglycan-binding domain-containing protein [Acidiferrimicrobium sp. IK]MCU4185320.1 LysM peptidoglycan-binding domain-containing protein [Acidiferrimicrobium sp. IK]